MLKRKTNVFCFFIGPSFVLSESSHFFPFGPGQPGLAGTALQVEDLSHLGAQSPQWGSQGETVSGSFKRMVFPWLFNGFSLVFPWLFNGFSMIFNGCSWFFMVLHAFSW